MNAQVILSDNFSVVLFIIFFVLVIPIFGLLLAWIRARIQKKTITQWSNLKADFNTFLNEKRKLNPCYSSGILMVSLFLILILFMIPIIFSFTTNAVLKSQGDIFLWIAGVLFFLILSILYAMKKHYLNWESHVNEAKQYKA